MHGFCFRALSATMRQLPIPVTIFALLPIAGYVALTPLPG